MVTIVTLLCCSGTCCVTNDNWTTVGKNYNAEEVSEIMVIINMIMLAASIAFTCTGGIPKCNGLFLTSYPLVTRYLDLTNSFALIGHIFPWGQLFINWCSNFYHIVKFKSGFFFSNSEKDVFVKYRNGHPSY